MKGGIKRGATQNVCSQGLERGEEEMGPRLDTKESQQITPNGR